MAKVTEAERAFWERLDIVETEITRLLALTAPMERAKEHACEERAKWNAEAERLANEINAALPKMPELMAERRMLRVALNGKTRPAEEVSDGSVQ